MREVLEIIIKAKESIEKDKEALENNLDRAKGQISDLEGRILFLVKKLATFKKAAELLEDNEND